MVLYYTLVRLAGVELLSLCRSIKKNIADLSQKISELASRPNGDNSQLMDQLSDELQVQQTQLKQTKWVTCELEHEPLTYWPYGSMDNEG